MEPPRKRVRLDASALLGHRGITISSVQAVLDALSDQTGDAFTGAYQSFREDAHKILDPTMVAEIKLDLTDGTDYKWLVASPQELVRRLLETSDCLKRAFARGKTSVENPWNIVLYFDEVTPGNIAAPTNYRKVMAFYFTFKEFGCLRIRYQAFWFQFAVLRTSIIQKVNGGLPAVVKQVLRLFFNEDNGWNSVGACVDAGTGPFMLFANLSNILGDEAALVACFDSKGPSGSKNCVLCVNCLKRGTFDHELEGFVDGTCTDLNKFIVHTTESVWQTVDDLQRLKATSAPGNFKLMEQSYGWKWNPQGLLMDSYLRRIVRPIECYTQDWAHVYLQHGVGSIELFHLLRKTKVTSDELLEDVRTWTWHSAFRNFGKNAWQTFSAKRRESSNKEQYWKASISEFLVAAPVVLHYVMRNRATHFPDETESFRKLCLLLDMIRSMKRGNMRWCEEFGKLSAKHYENTMKLYGIDIIIPKHHTASFHVAKQFARDGIVFDTFTVERMHQIPKQIGSVIKNTKTWEKSCLTRMVAYQINNAKTFDETSGLRGPTAQLAANVVLSKSIFYGGMRTQAGDWVMTSDQIVFVKGCGRRFGDLFLLVNIGDIVKKTVASATVRR